MLAACTLQPKGKLENPLFTEIDYNQPIIQSNFELVSVRFDHIFYFSLK